MMQMEMIALVCVAALVLISALLCIVIARLQSRHVFRCKHCGGTFHPRWTQLLFEAHALREHRIRCPLCNVKDFCEDQGRMTMKKIGERITYLPASSDPLSADVYFIHGDQFCYIYDVGNNPQALEQIQGIDKEKVVILSHYHKDHTGNISDIHCRELYVGQLTRETIGKGTVVEDSLTIRDGVKIVIMPCPSPHVDGSLIVNVDSKYTLIADLYFTRPPFDREKAMQMLDTLAGMDTEFFVVSHQEKEKVIEKARLIGELRVHFG